MVDLLLFYTLPVACIGGLCRSTGERLLAFCLYFPVMFFLTVVRCGFMGTVLLGGAAFFASLVALLAGFGVSLATRSRLAGALALSLSGSLVLWCLIASSLR